MSSFLHGLWPLKENLMSKIKLNKIEMRLRESIVNEVKDMADFHARPEKTKESGFYSIPRSVFSYTDYLGYLAFGTRDTTKRGVDFIKKYLPAACHDYAELVYSMWRHGTVHEIKPKSLYAEYPG